MLCIIFAKLRSCSSMENVTCLIHSGRTSFNPFTKTVFSSFAEAVHILRNNRESPYSIVSSRFCILSRSGGDGVVVVIRDSLLYAVTWQARKGRLEIPGSRRWSVVLQFDAHADVVENRNYHNDIHICRRIAGIPERSFYCLES